MKGTTIFNYKILKKLGSGGMADVWYAENNLGKPCAIKIMHSSLAKNDGIKQRFVEEAKTMMALDHKGIRGVMDIGEHEELPFILMEYVEGETLKEIITSGKKIEDSRVSSWFDQTISAIKHAHSQGVVHRDIKPSNVFITNDDKVKILDFGIAKIEGSISETMTGQTLGTLMYMSPEQIEDPKRVTNSTDYYSVGVTFYHLLIGKAPYDAKTTSNFQIQSSIVNQDLDISALPENWKDRIGILLNKNPELRMATGSADSQAYEGKTIIAPAKKKPIASKKLETKAPAKPPSKIPIKPIIIGAAILGVLALAYMLFSSKGNSSNVLECDQHKISALIASFTDEETDSFAYAVMNHMDKSLPDSLYEVRPVGYQTRQIPRYQDYIRENYFENSCDTSGIFVNGLRDEENKLFNLYASVVNLEYNNPEYLDTAGIQISSPRLLEFTTYENPNLIGDFMLLLMTCYEDSPDQCIKGTYQLQKDYQITKKSEANKKGSSILGPIALLRANSYAVSGNDSRAKEGYIAVETYGNDEMKQAATVNTEQLPVIVTTMKKEPSLNKLRNQNIQQQKKIEKKYPGFLDTIKEIINDILNVFR